MVIVTPGNVPANTTAQCNGLTVAVQGSDVLRAQTGFTGVSPHSVFVVSDGAGNWIVMNDIGS
jgi:hypothetical protein